MDDTIPFVTNEEINIRVAFEESVIVKGIPSIKILLHKADDTTVEAKATFKNAINTKVLNFIYKVQAGDLYSAMSIPKGDIDLNEGSIKLLSTNDANISYENVPENTNIKINSTITSISSISISSNPGADKTYTTGDKVEFKVEFTKAITITNTNAKLKFTLDETVKEASYKSGNDNTILFEYLIVSGDKDTNGISINSNAIAANSFGENIFLNNVAIASDENHKVSTTGSTIQHSYFETKPSIYYKAGDTITAILEFNENVVLTTSKLKPSLTLKLGDKLVKAQYKTIEDTKMYFSYIVQDKDTAKQGASIVKNSLNLNFAQLQNIVGLDVKLELNSLINAKNIIIDTLVPTLTIKIPKNQNKDFTVTIEASEEITIKDTNKFSINQGSINKIDLNENKKTITIKINAPTSYDGDISLKIEAGAVEDKARNSNTLTTETSFFSTSKPTISITTPLNNTKHLVDDGVLITGVSNIEDDQKITAKVGELKVGDFVVKNGKFEAIIPRAYFSKKYRYVRAYFEKTNSWLQIVELVVLDPKGKKLELNKEISLFKKVDDDYVKAIELDDLYSAEGAINGIRGNYGSYGNGMAHMPSGEYYLDLDLFEKYSIASVSLDTGAGRKAEVLSLQVSNDQIHWDTIKSHKDYANNITNHDWLSPFMEDTKVKLYATNKYGSTSEEVIRDLIPAIKATAKISLDKTVVKLGEDINISITLSPNTDLNSFGKDDIIAPNGTLGTLQTDPNNDYKKYINFTPNININDATNVITLKNTWTNKAGFNASLTTSKNYEVATKPVTITITDDQDKVTNKEIKYTFKLSSPSTSFTIEDIDIVPATAVKSNFTGSGDSYSLKVTPPEDYKGDLTLTIQTDKLNDKNGIGNLQAKHIQKVNTKAMPKPTIDDISTLTSFTETVTITGTGQVGATITIEFNNSKDTATVDNTKNWSLTLSNTNNLENDTYTIKAVMSDEAGNSNFARKTFTINLPASTPTLFIDSIIMVDNIINSFEAYNTKVSGKAKNLNNEVLTLKIGTITNTTTVSDDKWSIDNIDISSLDDGDITIIATVNNLSRSITILKDTEPMIPTFTTPKLLVNKDFNITLEFSKDVIGFDITKLKITNATISSLTKINDKKYTLAIDTSSITTKATVSVSIKKDTLFTRVGSKISDTKIEVIVDKTPPTLSFTSHEDNQLIGQNEASNLTLEGTTNTEEGQEVSLSFGGVDFKTATVDENGIWKKENINLGISSPQQITTSTNLLRVDDISNNVNFVKVSGGIESWYSILTDNSTSSTWGAYKETFEATTFRYDFKDIYNNGKFYIAFATTQTTRIPGQKVKFYLFDKLVYTSPSSTWSSSLVGNLSTNINFNRVDFVLTASGARVTEFKVYGQSIDRKFTAKVKDKAGNETSATISLEVEKSPLVNKITIGKTKLKKDSSAKVEIRFNSEVSTKTFDLNFLEAANAKLVFVVDHDESGKDWTHEKNVLHLILTPKPNIQYDNTNKIVVKKGWIDNKGHSNESSYTSVNYEVDTKSPAITNIAITSNAGEDKTYVIGDTITLEASFDEKITSPGDATIKIKIGEVEKTLSASVVTSSNNTNKLVFKYIVKAGDEDINGISVVGNTLTGNIFDTFKNEANTTDLSFTDIDSNLDHKVQSIKVDISNITFMSTPLDNNTYVEGEVIEIKLEISKPVIVLGEPTIDLEIGESIKKAIYMPTDKYTKILIFKYTVAQGDYDTDGIKIKANSLTLNKGSILDTNNQSLGLTFAKTINSNAKVDTLVSTIVITGPKYVNSAFDITVTLNKSRTTALLITVSNGTSLLLESNQKVYKYTITPDYGFNGNLTISIGKTTKTVVVDKTPPTLSFTSHKDNQLIGQNEASNLTLEGTTNAEEGQEVSLSFGGVDFKTATVDENGIWKKENINLGISSPQQITTSTNLLRVDDISNNVNFVKVSGGIESWYSILTDNSTSSTWGAYKETFEATTFRYDFKDIYNNGKFYIAFATTQTTRIPGQKVKFYLFDKLVYTSPSSTWSSSLVGNLSTNINFNRVDFVLTASGARVTEFKVYGQSIDRKFTAKVKDKAGNETSATISLEVEKSPLVNKITIGKTKLKKDSSAKVEIRFNSEVSTKTFDLNFLEAANAKLVFVVDHDESGKDWTHEKNVLHLILTPKPNIQYDNTNKIVVKKGWIDNKGHSNESSYTSVNYEVDTKSPAITNIAITSNAGEDKTYVIGDTITLEASFDEKITSAGDATIKIKIGEVEKTLSASVVTSSNNTNKLVFKYIVKAGDEDINGISVVGNTLTGNIFDTFRNEANKTDLSFVTILNKPNHKIKALEMLHILNINFSSNPQSNSTYVKDEDIKIELTISAPVVITLGATIDLEIGKDIKKAIYDSISADNKTLTFVYKVKEGDYDNDGIKIKANSLMLNKAEINGADGQILNLTFANITSYDKVNALPLTLVIDAPLRVKAAFDITVTLAQKAIPPAVEVSNATFKILGDNNVSKTVYKYTITPDSGFNGDVTITIGKTTKIVVVDIQAPTLTFNQVENTISPEKASNLTLEGTSSAENDQVVNLYIEDTFLGSTKVTGTTDTIDGTWSKSGLKLLENVANPDKGVVETYSGTKASMAGSSYADIRHIFDGNKAYGYSTATDFGEGLTKNFTTIFKVSTSLDHIRLYGGEGKNYRTYTLNAKWDFYDSNNEIVKTVTPTSYDKDYYFDIQLDGLFIKKIVATNRTSNYFSITELEIYRVNTNPVVTAKVQDQAGNEASATISLKVAHLPGIKIITINKTKFKKGSNASVEIKFTSEVNETFTKNNITTPNATLSDLVWSNENKTATATLTPKDGIQYDDTNKIVVEKGWIDNEGHTNESSYTSVNYEVDTKSPVLKRVVIFSNAGEDKTYEIGDKITLEASFDENITSSDAKIIIKIGAKEEAIDLTTANSNKLTFEYIVKDGDEDINGVSVVENTLTGNIFDTLGNKATDIAFDAINNSTSHKVSTAIATIKKISITSQADHGSYRVNDNITITVEFTKNVTVTNMDNNKPYIFIKVGEKQKQATYSSIDNTKMKFTYKVQKGDNDTDGISILKGKIILNGATVKNANIEYYDKELTDDPNHKVDTQAPILTFTNKNIVTSNFTIKVTANEPIQALSDDLITVSNNVSIGNITKNSDKEYTINFKIGNDTAENKDIVITFAKGAIQDIHGNGKESKSITITIKYDKTPPTLSFTSHSKNQSIGRLSNLTIAGTSDEIGAKVTLKLENKSLGTVIVQNDGSWKKENINLGISSPRKITYEWTNLLRVDGIPNNSNFVRVSGGISSWYYMLSDTNKTSWRESFSAKTYRYNFKDIYTNAHFYLHYQPGGAKSWQIRRPGQRVKFYLNDTLVYTSPVSGQENYFSKWVNPSMKFNRVDLVLNGSGARVTEFEVFGKSVDKINLSANVKDEAGNTKSTTLPLNLAASPIIKQLTISNKKLKKGDQANLVFTFNNAVKIDTFTTANITTPNASLSNLAWSNENKTATATLTPKDGIQYDGTNKIVVDKEWSDINDINPLNEYTSVNYEVDTTSPVLERVVISSNPKADSIYRIGDTITLEVSFDENITSSDAKIKIDIGGVEKILEVATSSTNKLIFKYIVKEGDEDTDGISIKANLTGDIFDTLKNKAEARNLKFDAVTNSILHKVKTDKSNIKAINITSKPSTINEISDTYIVDNEIEITTTFTKPISISSLDDFNKPYIIINIGGVTKYAIYKEVSDGLKMTFIYKVQKGELDTNGISVPKGKIMLNGAIVKTNDIIADIQYNNISDDANHKVDTQAPTLTFTNKNTVNSDFTIKVTVNEPIQVPNSSLITASNHVSIDGTPVISTNKKEYTINFKIDNTTTENKDIVITFAKGAIQDIHDNGNEIKTVTIKYNKTPPTLSFTSHEDNGEIYIKEALDLTLAGTTNAEDGQSVSLSVGTTSLGIATVQNGTWSKSAIALKDKYYQYVRVYGDGSNKNDGTHLVEVEVYDTNNVNVARGKAVQGYRVIDNQPFSITESSRITDGSKSDKYSYSDIGDGYKYVLLDLGGLHELKSIKVWRYFDGRKYNKTHIKVSKDNVTWLSVYDGSTPYAESSSGREFTTIPYTKILGEITLTAKVEDKAGNKTSKSISLTIEDFPRIETLTIDNTKLKKDATATLKFTFNTKINTSTFSKNDITTPNATLSDFTWNDDNNIATATLTPQSNIQYKATNKIVVDNSWRDFHGHFGLKYTGINYEVDTKNPILEEVIITSNGDDNIYAIGDTVTLEASFNENVTSKNAIIKVNIGTKERDLELIESSKNQKSSNKLSFAYTITDDDKDANGINVLANSITGDIFDTLDNKAEKNDLLFSAIYHSFSHTISTAIATIKTLKITSMPTSHTYGKDADIDITVEFTRAIEVALDEDKKPYIIINVGGIGKYAYYKSYSDSKIIFTYKVKKGDLDTNGISVPAAEIELNSATIQTANGKNADTKYDDKNLSDNLEHKVDAIPPVITFTKANRINGDFTVKVSADKDIIEPISTSIKTNNDNISVDSITKNNDKEYTINFKIGTDTTQGDIVITFAKGAIQDIYGNKYEEKQITITYDTIKPTLSFTSHKDNQLIGQNEALDLTLGGNSDAIGSLVTFKESNKDLGNSTTVGNDNEWEQKNIKLRIIFKENNNNIEFEATKAYWGKLSNLLDGNKQYGSKTGVEISKPGSEQGDTNEGVLTVTLKIPKIINNLTVWSNTFAHPYNNYYLSKKTQGLLYQFYNQNGYKIGTDFQKGLNKPNDYTYKIFPHTDEKIKKITISGTELSPQHYFYLSELEIYVKNIEQKITAKVKDEAGNEKTEDLNLRIVDGFTLLSDSVKEGTALDKKYSYSTADETRENISPQLKWGAAPADTKSYAIIMDDTTANNWIHWNVFNIPKTITSFEEGWSSTHSNANSDGIQQNTAQGITEPANKYVGPWPDNHPIAKHTYQIKIYALNIETLDDNTSTQNTVSFESTHGTNILGSTTLTFTFTAPLSSER